MEQKCFWFRLRDDGQFGQQWLRKEFRGREFWLVALSLEMLGDESMIQALYLL